MKGSIAMGLPIAMLLFLKAKVIEISRMNGTPMNLSKLGG